MSREFVWGVGHSERPIVAAVAAQGVVAVGFLRAAGFGVLRNGSPPAGLVLGVALLARLTLLPSNLVQASDCYRYVLDGAAVLHGVNPFRHAPDRVQYDAPERFRRALENPDAQRVVARINNPDLPTIYPPLAQTAFAAGAALVPWDWRGQRWVFLAFDVATILLLMWGLKRLGRPVAWAAVYAWNPIVLKEIANSAHLDSLVGLCVLALCLTLLLSSGSRSLRAALGAGVFFAAAVSTKVYPVILAPICLAALARDRGRFARLVAFCLGGSMLGLAALAPFVSVGPARLLESAIVYAGTWVNNEGAFALLDWGVPFPRIVAVLIPVAVAFIASWEVLTARPDRVNDSIVAGFQATLLAWFLFLPAAFPWYAVALFAVCALRPRPWCYVLSISFGLYYLLFLYDYRDFSPAWGIATQAIEHGAVWAALAAGLVVAVHRRLRSGREEPCESA